MLRNAFSRRVPELPVIALLLAFFAARGMLMGGLFQHLGQFDEGLLVTDAFLMGRGQFPHRDFYSNYPSGIYQLIRIIWWTLGESVWPLRLFGASVRFLTGIAAGFAAARLSNRRFCTWTMAITWLLQDALGFVLFAYPVAVLCGLGSFLALPKTAVSNKYRELACGFLLGMASWFRHDLFVYWCVTLGAVECLHWIFRRSGLLLVSWKSAAWRIGGIGAALAIFWPLFFFRAGIGPALKDLVIDQAVLVMPARQLPIPNLGNWVDVPSLGLELPWALTDRTGITILLTILAVSLAWSSVIFRMTRRQHHDERVQLLIFIAAGTTATLPQAFQRVDYYHVVYGIPFILVCLSGVIGHIKSIRGVILATAALPMLIGPHTFIRWSDLKRFWGNRADEHYLPADRIHLRDFIQRETQLEEPIFIGCRTHVRIVANPSVDIYYVARRIGATRYMQFDPGTTTGERGQLEMVADIKRNRPKVLLRQDSCFWYEPNASQNLGSHILDDYLAEHYISTGRLGDFEIWRPKS